MKQPLIIIAGPTAAGKTALSVELAKKINGSVISADSMQVYKGMDIGSAKITKEEMQGIPHYLIDIIDPADTWNVAEFQQKAKEALNDIYKNDRIPIVAGGTGFYVQALLYDIDFTKEDEDTAFRKEMEAYAKEHGNHALHEMLRSADPKAAEEIHENNVKRVIRALEFNRKTNKRISEHNEEQRKKKSPYNFAYFVLNDDRSKLYERIDLRVDQMLQAGLVDEVKKLKDQGFNKDMVSMKGLGYKEILSYLDGECSLEEAVYILKRDTRHFAKRQLTWFRREPDVIWLDRSEYNGSSELLADACIAECQKRGILSMKGITNGL